MNIIVSNNEDFTRVCSSIEEAYKALCEAYNLPHDDYIHIEFCNINAVGNNESANYEAIIWKENIRRF